MSTLKERIRIAFTKAQLRANGITQKALAEACGVTPPSVNQWFSGKTLVIDMDNAKKAAEYLGCDPVWLATGEGDESYLLPDDDDMHFASPHMYVYNSDKLRVLNAHAKRESHIQLLKEKAASIDFDNMQPVEQRPTNLTALEHLAARKNTSNATKATIAKEPLHADLFNRKKHLGTNIEQLRNATPYLNNDEQEEFFNVLRLALLERDEKTYLDYLHIISYHVESAIARAHQEADALRMNELREKLQLKPNKAKNE